MNTQYFRYALEVEKTGSITQAANNLFMSQPTLSKAIKDMEETVGFPIFKRTSKGVVPTHRGTEFLAHARKIASEVQKMEQALQRKDGSHQLFSLAIPRASYVAQAAADFLATFNQCGKMEIDVLEDNSMRVLDSVADGHFVLGIIRCHVEDREYFVKNISEKDLQYESIWQGGYVALMREDHPLAQQENLTCSDFLPYIEVAYGDDKVPYIRTSEAKTTSGLLRNEKRILIYSRAMQLDLLQHNSLTYMWTSPVPADVLSTNHLVQRRCSCSHRCQFEDILISRAGYRFSRLDRAFIDQLYLQRNQVAYPG